MILMACQLVQGYFMPWDLGIAVIVSSYLHFLWSGFLRVFFFLHLVYRIRILYKPPTCTTFFIIKDFRIIVFIFIVICTTFRPLSIVSYKEIHSTIQIKQTIHAEHWWRKKDELISDLLKWIPTYRCTSVSRPSRTSIHQLCANTERCLEDLPRVIDDKEGWQERPLAISAIWLFDQWMWS